MVKILYLAAFVDPPCREDIQDLYAMLWENPIYNLVQKEVILLRPPETVCYTIMKKLREDGYDLHCIVSKLRHEDDLDNLIDFVAPLHLIH